MTGLFISIFANIGMKLLTEKMFGKVLVYSLAKISLSTANTLDDKMVDSIAEALGIVDQGDVR